MSSSGLKLALYHDNGCPFSLVVMRTIDEHGIDVERRNIDREHRYFRELHRARGRTTVPVLRIEHANGEIEWMPESLDIVRYLRRHAGVEEARPYWLEYAAHRAGTLGVAFGLAAVVTGGVLRWVSLGLFVVVAMAWLGVRRADAASSA